MTAKTTDERLSYFEPGPTHGVWSAYNEPLAAWQLASLLDATAKHPRSMQSKSGFQEL